MSVVGVGPVGRSGDDAANQRPCQQLGEPSTGKADKEKTRTQPLQISKRQLVLDSTMEMQAHKALRSIVRIWVSVNLLS